MNDEIAQGFLNALDAWICDGYSADIRYLARLSDAGIQLLDSSVTLYPLPPGHNTSFQIESSQFVIGHTYRISEKKKALLPLLRMAAHGKLQLPDASPILTLQNPFYFYSEMTHRDRWFSELHLSISGSERTVLDPSEISRIDDDLRSSTPPFDGLSDIISWLGLSDPTTGNVPSITLRVVPPVDIVFNETVLSDDQLCLTLHALPKFDVSRVGVAIRTAPGNGLDGRKQIASEIKWDRAREGRRKGEATVNLHNADNVLIILMIENMTVRRQWFIDPSRTRNDRLIAVQHFDKDLRMLRYAVFESPDSGKFEQGVASLLFLLGFNASIQVETDSPDIIVTTPNGRLMLAECTTRISDFIAKTGKLVDRRGALYKSLQASGHPAPIFAVLICRSPRDQIVAHSELLRIHNVILMSGEDLSTAFDRLRLPNDPDRMLDDAVERNTEDPHRGSI